jgi:alpha-tubulin suppressor-like RCC1 family protein
MAAGTDYSLAVQTDATLWEFGSNSSGQLGDGTMTGRVTPVPVIGTPGGWALLSAHPSQTAYALALQNGGSAWGWGANGSGQLGDGTLTVKFSPSLQP